MEIQENTIKSIAKSATFYKFSCPDASICEHPGHHFMNIYTLILKVAIIFLLIFLHFSQFNRTFAQHFEKNVAPVAKLVDALDLGSNVSRCAGSSPVRRTKRQGKKPCFFYCRRSITHNL